MSERTKQQIEDKLIEVAVNVALEAVEVGALYLLQYLRQKKQEIVNAA